MSSCNTVAVAIERPADTSLYISDVIIYVRVVRGVGGTGSNREPPGRTLPELQRPRPVSKVTSPTPNVSIFVKLYYFSYVRYRIKFF